MSRKIPSLTKTWRRIAYPAIDPPRPALSLEHKTILVTGGGSGLGASVAHSFALAGAAHILLLGHTHGTLSFTTSSLRTSFPSAKVSIAVADIRDEKAVAEAFNLITNGEGRVNVLVSNAAYLSDTEPVATANVEEWFKAFETNVKGALIVAQAFLKAAAPKATLINVSSAIAQFDNLPWVVRFSYSSSKMAVVRMLNYLAVENPCVHVVVHLHPGTLKTPMNQKAGLSNDHDDMSLPAGFVVWLASSEAAFLRRKFVTANWEVEELIGMKEKIEKKDLLTIKLDGWPFQDIS